MATSQGAALVAVCTVLLLCCSPSWCDDLPTADRVGQLAGLIKSSLYDSFMDSSAYAQLKNSYADDLSNVRFDPVDPEAELAAMATKITGVFSKRTLALTDIVQAAEDSTITYPYNTKLRLEDVPLFKMADYNESSPELNYSRHFRREVDGRQSGVHTPLEVYEGYLDVLNGLQWSSAVDEVFKANREREPGIGWQYLGSQLGFLRVFPATWWQPPAHLDGVDLYDVRRRPWYIEAAVSPKDVVILMDISGSVHGQTFEIMKIAVKTVLNTLGENDYVNIAWTTNHVGWVNKCIDTLVPATMVNKRLLFAAVDALEARNTSNWAMGLEFAYNAFIDFDSSAQPEQAGANCHKLIMFFSDGGTEWPGDVIDKYKNDTVTKDVRLFTYALGPHPVPSHIMRKIACDNGGTFSVIVASGAIRTTIQESYLAVLAQPLGLSNSHPMAESSPYLNAEGLGYVTTLSTPVFNKSQSSDGQSLVGVAGVDITMKELHAFSPDQKLGPFGYTFAINPNGIVMFHPRLREPLHYMEDPPDLDLTLLEGNNQMVLDMRTQMIRRNANSVTMAQTLVLPDGHSVEVPNLNISYRAIANTTLSLGVVTQTGHHYLVASGQSVSAGLPDCTACLVAPSWDYCPDLTANGTERWQQLSDLLKENARTCDAALVQHLLWDAGWTAEVAPFWNSSQPEGVAARFVVTASGLMRLFPNTSAAELAPEGEPHRSSLYKHAALSDDLVLRSRPQTGHVLAARRVASAKSTGSTYTLAVAGVQYNASHLLSLVSSALGAECSEQLGVRCWVLDTAGHILYSSREVTDSALGSPLGLSDPQLMYMLVNASVFVQHTEYIHQGVCHRQMGKVSAGARPWGVLSLQLLLDGVAGVLQWLDHLRYLLVSVLVSAQAAPAAALDEFGFEIHAFEHSCSQRVGRTRPARTPIQPAENSLTCPDSGCTRHLRAAPLQKTNLLLVVSSLPCQCPELDVAPVPYSPEDDVLPDMCEEEQTTLVRKRPEDCFARRDGVKPACVSSAVPLAAVQSLLVLLSALATLLPCHLVAS